MSGVAVVLIAAAVIVIFVTVCLRKRNNKHVNVSDNVAYGVSRNEIELSACDDAANQPSSGQLKMKNNTETRASDSNYTDDMYAYVTPPTTAILTSNVAYNVHTSTYVVYDLPTSSGNRETTTTNEAYDVTCKARDYEVAVPIRHLNQAYGT